ncbi:pyrimidine utilization protein D [Aliiglaciecola aliphaticivorans]
MFYEVVGLQDSTAPTVVLSSGLGGSGRFWETLIPVLESTWRIIVYDHNGTGRSPASLPNDYSIKSMSKELLALLNDIQIQQCHFVGHALGGLVGLEIALQRPEILQSLVLINAWSSPNPHTLRCFNIRKALLHNCSAEVYLQMQALMLYPPDWIAENVELLNLEEQHMLKSFPDKQNLLARISALSQFDIDGQLNAITTNTLIIANKDDALVPWQRSAILANGIGNSKLHIFEYGGHACTVTITDEFNQLLLEHLNHFLKGH